MTHSRFGRFHALCARLAGAGLLLLGLAVTSGTQASERHVVQPGDTLGTIARKHYGDSTKWRLILRANKDRVERDGKILAVGTVLVIPELDLETAPTYGTAQGRVDQETGLLMVDLIARAGNEPLTGRGTAGGGVVTEIVKAAFNRLGYEPRIRFVAWDSEADLGELSEYAAAFPQAPSPALRGRFLLSDAVLQTRDLVYWRRDLDLEFTAVKDLRNQRVCTTKAIFQAYFKDMVEEVPLDLNLPDRSRDCFDSLAQRAVDAVVADELESATALAALDLRAEVRQSETPVSTGELIVLFPKFSAHGRALRYQFNSALRKLRESGDLQRILGRHLQPDRRSAEAGVPRNGSRPVPAGDAFALHLSSFKSKAAAMDGWDELKVAFPAVLGRMELIVEPVKLGPGETFYRVLAGPLASQSAADGLCSELQAKEQYCLTVPVQKAAAIAAPREQPQLETQAQTGRFSVMLASFGTLAEAERYSAWVSGAMSGTLGDLKLETDSIAAGEGGKSYRVLTEALPEEGLARELCARLEWPFCRVVQR